MRSASAVARIERRPGTGPDAAVVAARVEDEGEASGDGLVLRLDAELVQNAEEEIVLYGLAT